MSEILLGVLGMLIAFLLFGAGMFLGWKANDRMKAHTSAAVAQELTEKEKRKIELERERLAEEQRAFSAILGYNADIAYGKNAEANELLGKE